MTKSTQPPKVPSSFAKSDITWLDQLTIQCQNAKLRLTQGFNVLPSTDDTITLFKDPKFIQAYLSALDGHNVDHMVEVGIWDGGSAIFFWNLLKPKKLCCIELKPTAGSLTNYIDRENISEQL